MIFLFHMRVFRKYTTCFLCHICFGPECLQEAIRKTIWNSGKVNVSKVLFPVPHNHAKGFSFRAGDKRANLFLYSLLWVRNPPQETGMKRSNFCSQSSSWICIWFTCYKVHETNTGPPLDLCTRPVPGSKAANSDWEFSGDLGWSLEFEGAPSKLIFPPEKVASIAGRSVVGSYNSGITPTPTRRLVTLPH